MDKTVSSILHLTPRYFPDKGGVETHLHELNKRLVADGYQVTVLTIQTNLVQALDESIEQVKIIRIPLETASSKTKLWQWMRMHRNYFTQNKIIHVHDVSWWLLPFFPWIIKKYFMTFHGWEGIYPVPIKNKLQRLFFALCAKKTIHVGEYIQFFYWDKPSKITYGGITASTKPEYSVAHSPLRFAFIGRLVAENDIKKYFDLLSFMQINNQKFSITWVGEGIYKNEAEQFGHVTGMVKNVQNEILKADIIFASSYLSILEAQAMGKIVVSLYSHPLKKQYLKKFPGSNSMIIENDSAEAANKIVALSENKSLFLKKQNEAYSFAITQSWEKVAQLYKQLWND